MFACWCANPACQINGCAQARAHCYPNNYQNSNPELTPNDWAEAVRLVAEQTIFLELKRRVEELEKKLAAKEAESGDE